MSETSELIAQQILNGNINKRTWGDVFFNVKANGVKGDGVSDDTVALNAAIALAQSAGLTVFLPAGTYLVDYLNYGSVVNAKQMSMMGFDKKNTIIKKRTADGGVLCTIGSATGTNYTGPINISGITFQGIPDNTAASVRCYDVVRTQFNDCRFTGSIIGLDFQGGIANNLNNCIADYNQIGWRLTKFTSLAGGGWPNLNTAYASLFLDNTQWGVWFDYGRILNLNDCEIEGNGAVGTYGGLYVGPNIGAESPPLLSIGVNIRNTWFEANKGHTSVYFSSGRNSISEGYFVANNSATYDVYVSGGRYNLEFCDFDSNKLSNVYEEAAVLTGNYIYDCDYANATYDNLKTMVFNSANKLAMRGGEVPVMVGLDRPFMQQGIDNTATGVVTVTFPVAFALAPNVQITMNNDSSNTLDVPEVYNVSTTGFTVRKKSITSGSATVGTTNAGFYWRAIGKGV